VPSTLLNNSSMTLGITPVVVMSGDQAEPMVYVFPDPV
jgi:hypothetical protein